MCTPINKIDYDYDCNQTLQVLRKDEKLQYIHLFSLVCSEGTIKNLIILSEDIVFPEQYIIVKGFFEQEPERITRWFVKRVALDTPNKDLSEPTHKDLSKPTHKGSQEPLCYGDTIKLYDTSELKNSWQYPRNTSTKGTEFQLCWNDGKVPPKVSSTNNIVIKQEKSPTIKETTVTVYKKDIGWLVAGSVLIALVVILLIIVIALLYKFIKNKKE